MFYVRPSQYVFALWSRPLTKCRIFIYFSSPLVNLLCLDLRLLNGSSHEKGGLCSLWTPRWDAGMLGCWDAGRGGSKGLSRFLKPQSGNATNDTFFHRERTVELAMSCQRGKQFVPSAAVRPRRGLMVASDYGFKNPAQVHLEYKVLFS